MSFPKIVSLIASSTETICALGFSDLLVGRSHECDYPDSISRLPACSSAKFNTEGTSAEIDQRVQDTLKNALSVYNVDIDKLQFLTPSLIVTQDKCDVCAVSLSDVESAAAEVLTSKPQIVSLAPNNLEEISQGIIEIAEAIGDRERGVHLVESMRSRIEAITSITHKMDRKPRVACIEWIDPLIGAGNWIPELVDAAGGRNTIGQAGYHAPRLPLFELEDANPEYIVAMPCGWGIEKARSEMDRLSRTEIWPRLRAVKEGNVFLVDGNQYFNRPGPRVVDSIEIMAEILHPTQFDFGHNGQAWTKY